MDYTIDVEVTFSGWADWQRIEASFNVLLDFIFLVFRL